MGATLVVAAALVVGGIGLRLVLTDTMIGNVDTSLELRAADIAALIVGGAEPRTLTIEGEDDGFVQLLSANGDVLAASENIEGEGPIVASRVERSFDMHSGPVDEGLFRVRVGKTQGQDSVTVVVGRSLREVDEAITTLVLTLLVGIPMLVALVAAVTWMVTGRALRPVEAMRAEVADITASDLHRRVPTTTSMDEVGRLATTMNEMLERLDSANARQQRFVSDASHELRSPLASVRHLVEIARRSASDDGSSLLDELDEEHRRMEQLVDDLLLLARSSHDISREDGVHVDRVEFDDLVLVDVHRRRDGDVTIEVGSTVEAVVCGDRDRLSRVVRNLTDNAARHASTRVVLTVESDSETVRLHVDDDGPGVPVDDRLRIFERFTRLDDARARASGGSGLGLAIVSEIVRSHRGSVEASESALLGGARFSITLPTGAARCGGT